MFEFDSGSKWTLAIGFTHASITIFGKKLLRTGVEHVKKKF